MLSLTGDLAALLETADLEFWVMCSSKSRVFASLQIILEADACLAEGQFYFLAKWPT